MGGTGGGAAQAWVARPASRTKARRDASFIGARTPAGRRGVIQADAPTATHQGGGHPLPVAAPQRQPIGGAGTGDDAMAPGNPAPARGESWSAGPTLRDHGGIHATAGFSWLGVGWLAMGVAHGAPPRVPEIAPALRRSGPVTVLRTLPGPPDMTAALVRAGAQKAVVWVLDHGAVVATGQVWDARGEDLTRAMATYERGFDVTQEEGGIPPATGG